MEAVAAFVGVRPFNNLEACAFTEEVGSHHLAELQTHEKERKMTKGCSAFEIGRFFAGYTKQLQRLVADRHGEMSTFPAGGDQFERQYIYVHGTT